ncbi:MAG: LamG domain-containing protein [Saprospirales bacterium]|nr:LamG domain-containing protein [Saprospirales bacterium]
MFLWLMPANLMWGHQQTLPSGCHKNNRCRWLPVFKNEYYSDNRIPTLGIWGKLLLEWRLNNGTNGNLATSINVNDNVCHHVALVVSRSGPSRARLYVDGVQQASSTNVQYSWNVTNSNPAYLGRERTGGTPFIIWVLWTRYPFPKSIDAGRNSPECYHGAFWLGTQPPRLLEIQFRYARRQ